jgi:hypothetical protein
MPGADRLEAIVTLTDAPTAEEEHAIGSGLARFNEQQSGIRDSRPLAVVVRDPQTKQPVGGLTGRTSLGLLFMSARIGEASRKYRCRPLRTTESKLASVSFARWVLAV